MKEILDQYGPLIAIGLLWLLVVWTYRTSRTHARAHPVVLRPGGDGCGSVAFEAITDCPHCGLIAAHRFDIYDERQLFDEHSGLVTDVRTVVERECIRCDFQWFQI